MSECTRFRVLLLEAEPDELRGEGDGPLARHLNACPACARAAAVLLEETAHLDAWLSAAPTPDVDALLARAGSVAGVSRMRRLWLPLAAAAALATLLLLRAPEVATPPGSAAAAVARRQAPLVEPAAGQDAAVMQTGDPDITVVWLFSTG